MLTSPGVLSESCSLIKKFVVGRLVLASGSISNTTSEHLAVLALLQFSVAPDNYYCEYGNA